MLRIRLAELRNAEAMMDEEAFFLTQISQISQICLHGWWVRLEWPLHLAELGISLKWRLSGIWVFPKKNLYLIRSGGSTDYLAEKILFYDYQFLITNLVFGITNYFSLRKRRKGTKGTDHEWILGISFESGLGKADNWRRWADSYVLWIGGGENKKSRTNCSTFFIFPPPNS